MKQNSKRLDVTLNLLGTIIGAGIFGLPAVMAKTGVIGGTVLFFFVLMLALSLHLLFAEVILADKVKRRFAGYASYWLGSWARWPALIVFFLKCAGAILAYIILGGEFISVLAHNFGIYDAIWFWQLVFWAVGAAIVFFGLKIVTSVEDELTWLLIGAMIFSGVVLVPFFDWQGIGLWHAMGLWPALGVMFFSVTALTVIPESVDIAGRKPKVARAGIIWGTLLAGLLSWMFGLTIALAYPGVVGAQDIPMAFPPIFWWLIPVVGILAVVTSYLTVTQALKNLLSVDIGVGKGMAWFVAVTAPLILFAVTSRDFLSTVGFIGGVLTGLAGIIVCACAWVAMRRRGSRKAWYWRWSPLFISLILLAIVLQELLMYAKM